MSNESVDIRLFKASRLDRREEWLSERPDNADLCAWLLRCNEYCPAKNEAGIITQHPTIEAVLRSKQMDFYRSMGEALQKYGGLTQAQTDAAHRMKARFMSAVSGDEEVANAETTEFYGQPGQRVLLTVYVERCINYRTQEGYSGFLNLCDTYEGHRVVYSSTKTAMKEGSSVTMYATIVAHKRYRGEAQTMVSRAKIVETILA